MNRISTHAGAAVLVTALALAATALATNSVAHDTPSARQPGVPAARAASPAGGMSALSAGIATPAAGAVSGGARTGADIRSGALDASPYPVISWGQMDENAAAESKPSSRGRYAPGAAVVFLVYGSDITSATWTVAGFAPVAMHAGRWPFTTQPIAGGEREWLGLGVQDRPGMFNIVRYWKSGRVDVTVKAWDRTSLTVMTWHFRCAGDDCTGFITGPAH